MAGASEGVGIAGAEEPVPEETGGAGGVTNPDSVQGTDARMQRMAAYPMLQNGVKEQDPETGTEDKDPPLQFVFAGDILLSDHAERIPEGRQYRGSGGQRIPPGD
ncbi:MAG: hypothetical protein ACLR0U_02700 [Enterocloster clostridioformis]